MHPHRFDELTQVLAGKRSRRQLILGSGAAVLAGIAGTNRAKNRSFAQSGTMSAPATAAHWDYLTTYPPLNPIPVGDGRFFIDGKTVTLDPGLATRFAGVPFAPVEIDGETYFINPAVVASEFQPGTPAADAVLATPTVVPAGIPPTLMGSLPEPQTRIELPESVCGADDSRDVELYKGEFLVTKAFVEAHQAPVGNIRWNGNLPKIYGDHPDRCGNVNTRRWCSGTLIMEDLFLTAGHCFSQCPQRWCTQPPYVCPQPCPPPLPEEDAYEVPKKHGSNVAISREEIALNMHVGFNYQIIGASCDQPHENICEERDEERFKIIELVEDQLGGLDYAIVRLEKAPGAAYGKAHIAAADPTQGDVLCIIGHPAAAPKRIATGHVSPYEGSKIVYRNLDTAPGSSGSGILSNTTGLIVGVHTTGGCNKPDGGKNHGVRISELLKVSPILRKLAQAKPT